MKFRHIRRLLKETSGKDWVSKSFMLEKLVIKQHENKKHYRKEKLRTNVLIPKSLHVIHKHKSTLLKLIALVCLMILGPKHFVVLSRKQLKLEIIFPYLLLYGLKLGKFHKPSFLEPDRLISKI